MRGLRFALLLGVAAFAMPAAAEMYKCQGPDGKTLYTSDRSQCPGASKHTPKGQVQSAGESRTPRRALPARQRSGGGSSDEAAAAAWRSKKSQAEQRLAALNRDLPDMYKAVGWCNRGGELFTEDERGIRRGYSCDRVESEYAEAQEEKATLEAYLAEGLEEECRKAGCLPGWVR